MKDRFFDHVCAGMLGYVGYPGSISRFWFILCLYLNHYYLDMNFSCYNACVHICSFDYLHICCSYSAVLLFFIFDLLMIMFTFNVSDIFYLHARSIHISHYFFLVNNGLDSSGPDEQQKQSQPEIQNQTPANGSIQPGMPMPPALYMMPCGQLEEGATMVMF